MVFSVLERVKPPDCSLFQITQRKYESVQLNMLLEEAWLVPGGDSHPGDD